MQECFTEHINSVLFRLSSHALLATVRCMGGGPFTVHEAVGVNSKNYLTMEDKTQVPHTWAKEWMWVTVCEKSNLT